LKKNKSKEIQTLANDIIAKWKAAVDQEKKKKRPAEDAAESTSEKKVKTEVPVKSERKEGVAKVKSETDRESLHAVWTSEDILSQPPCSIFCQSIPCVRTPCQTRAEILYYR